MPYIFPFSRVSKRVSIIISATLLLVFALGLRIHHLDHESLFMDELLQISYYPHPFNQIVYDAAFMAQPPLDYWIGHLVHAFSYSDFAVRLPSALFGTGVVLMLIFLTARMCSWPVGACVGIIASLLPFNLYFSQEARPYSIAVFFFLTVLWFMDYLLVSENKKIEKAFGLLLFATAFLYSRALSPLVVIVIIVFILIIRFSALAVREGFTFKDRQHSVVLAGAALGLALLLYFPSFNLLLDWSERYLRDSSPWFGIDTLTNGIRHFDIFPIWQAFVVQTEPLTLPLLILILLSPYFAWRSGLWERNSLWLISTILLPGASILNIFVFQSKSGMPFRPPYAIYMLPLALMLGAITFQGIWTTAGKIRGYRIIRFFLLVAVVVFIFHTAYSAWSFKYVRKKTDWRGVSNYLSTSFNSEYVLIFDALTPYGEWEPTFFGFPRYYKGQSPLISMAQLPYLSSEATDLTYEPVVVLFQWREYYLTPYSRYPIIPLPIGMKYVDYHRISQDPLFQIADFTGFSVIRLRESSDNFAADADKMINRLLLSLPQDSSVVELHLAAARLGRILGHQNWQKHSDQAKVLISRHARADTTNR